MILQLRSRVPEGIINGESQIGMALVRRWRTRDIDLASFRKRQMNFDLIEATGTVMSARTFHHYPASCYPTATLL
jgi:hypothetical protein